MKAILVFFCTLSVFIPCRSMAEEYVFSLLPRYYPEKLTAMATPLVQHLGVALQMPVQLRLMENFDKFEAEAASGAIAIGYENPLVYCNISKYHEVVATAQLQDGGDKIRGVVIARNDSAIRSLEDLKGKTVMIVGRTSAGGYLSQKLAMQEAGLDVNRDCRLVEAADNRQENVIISVSIGDVDAGFIIENALHIADEFIMPNSIKMVAETNRLPNWALSVNRTMPQKHKEMVKAAVLNLTGDSPVLKALDLTGFKAAVDADYDVIRNLKE